MVESQRLSEASGTNPFAASVILVPLILGIMMTTAGIALMISDLGLISLVLGVVFLTTSFIGSRRLSTFLYRPEESTAMALYVAVEFLAGAALELVAVGNIVFDSEAVDWNLVAIAVFGVLLMVDSVLLYHRGFRKNLGREKGV